MAFHYNPKIVTNGLVLFLDAAASRSYPGSGTTWIDVSPFKNNGTLSNGPIYSTTNFGSFSFDGIDDVVNFSNTSSLQFLNVSPYTLEAWVRPNTNPGTGNFTGIFDRESNTVNGRDGYNLFFLGSTGTDTFFTTERFTSDTNTNTSITVPQSESVNSWNHIVVTYDSSTLKIYRNGKFGNQTGSNGNITNTAKFLTIARRSSNYFNGSVACARVYNIALTADEVQQNFGALRGRFGL